MVNNEEKILLRTEFSRELTHLELDRNLQYVANYWSGERHYLEGMIVYYGGEVSTNSNTDSLNYTWFRANKNIVPDGIFHYEDWDVIGANSIAGNIKVQKINLPYIDVSSLTLGDFLEFDYNTKRIDVDAALVNYWEKFNEGDIDEYLIYNGSHIVVQNIKMNVSTPSNYTGGNNIKEYLEYLFNYTSKENLWQLNDVANSVKFPTHGNILTFNSSSNKWESIDITSQFSFDIYAGTNIDINTSTNEISSHIKLKNSSNYTPIHRLDFDVSDPQYSTFISRYVSSNPVTGEVTAKIEFDIAAIAQSSTELMFSKSYNEVITLINTNQLLPGAMYKITGVDTLLYGGTTVYLKALSKNTLEYHGHGLFENPYYNKDPMNSREWELDNIGVDLFSGVNGLITYRHDRRNNRVEHTDEYNTDSKYLRPINRFKWFVDDIKDNKILLDGVLDIIDNDNVWELRNLLVYSILKDDCLWLEEHSPLLRNEITREILKYVDDRNNDIISILRYIDGTGATTTYRLDCIEL